MTIWYAIYAILVAICIIGLLVPLVRGSRTRALARSEAELAMQRSRLEQVRHDVELGLLKGEDAAQTEAEIGRTILRTAREAEADTGPVRIGGVWPVATMTVLCLGVSIAIYSRIGTFGAGDLPLADRNLPAAGALTAASDHEGGQIREAIVSLRQRLAQDPTNAQNWALLARSLSAVGAYGDAASAYGKVMELAPMDLEARGNYAEALIRASNGLVTGPALDAFEIVLAHEPKDPRARYYVALGHAQAGRDREAAEGWAAIVRDAPAGAPYVSAIRKILDAVIEDAGIDRASLDLPADEPNAESTERGPTTADMAAAAKMSADERETMIRGMVARLEERLADEPGDVDGWLRLARAKMVLEDRAAAVATLEKALTANPDAAKLVAALSELKGN